MSRTPDEIFFDTFMGILAALVVFTVAVGFIANAISGRTVKVSQITDSDMQAAMIERIAPIGSALIAGEEARPSGRPLAATPPPAAPVPMAAAEPRDAETVYNLACVACHGMGIAGAPKVGDADAWTARVAQGMEVLADHAINGYNGSAGYMPARGGNMTLTDDEVIAAVELMVNQSQ